MQNLDNGKLLRKAWDELYGSKDSKLIFMGNIEQFKVKKMGEFFTILNPAMASKRNTSMPKQKAVFMNFDSDKFNFSKVSNRQILFHINLDEEEIISKENAHKMTEKFFQQQQGEQGQIQGHAHPLLVNIAPICRYHCLLSMYPDEQLPQILGQDIMLLLLNIFKVLPGVRISYNSLGGSASINHLHFHVFFAQQLVGEDKLPIQKAARKQWYKSSLINPQQQINLYSVGVRIEEIASDYLTCFVLTPVQPKNAEFDASQSTNSLSYVFGLLVNQLIEMTIPHNIYISDNGMTIYVYVRDFSKYPDGWLEFSGIQMTLSQDEFNKATPQALTNRLKTAKIDSKIIDTVKSNLKSHLDKFI